MASRQRRSSSRCSVLTTQNETSTATRTLLSPRMRVDVVDPSAYTPPYDHALCDGAGPRAGADVRLVTSRFAYGGVPRPRRLRASGALLPARGRPRGRGAAAPSSPSTCPTCSPTGRRPGRPTSCTSSGSPSRRSTPACCRRGRPLVLTAHDVLARAAARRAGGRLRARSGACSIASTRSSCTPSTGAGACWARPGSSPRRCTSSRTAPSRTCSSCPRSARCRPSWPRVEGPVVLFFGLLRPYKGLDVLLEAWRGINGAELWVVGMPRMDLGAAARRRAAGGALRRALRGRRRDPGALPPRGPRRPALPRDRPVRRAFTALAFGRAAAAQRRRRLPRDRRGRRRRARPPRRPRRRCATRCAALLADPAARGAWPPARAPPRPRALRLGRDRPRRTSTSTAGSPREAAEAALAAPSGARRALLAYAQAGYPLLLAACARLRVARRAAAARGAGAAEPRVSADRRRPPRGGGHRGQGRQRPRARLARRPPGGHRRLRRLARRDARTRARGGRRPRPRAAVGRQGPRPGRRRRRRRRRAARLLRRQRAWEPARLRALVAPSPTRASATPAVRSASSATAARTRRACTGATRWRSARSSRDCLGHRRQRRDLRRAPRGLHRGRPDHGPRPLVSLQRRQARLARVYVPQARATEKMVPTIEGEFARKRRMMSHAWPIVLRGGLLDRAATRRCTRS